MLYREIGYRKEKVLWLLTQCIMVLGAIGLHFFNEELGPVWTLALFYFVFALFMGAAGKVIVSIYWRRFLSHIDGPFCGSLGNWASTLLLLALLLDGANLFPFHHSHFWLLLGAWPFIATVDLLTLHTLRRKVPAQTT